ncbi:MAG: CBS domain-containing protein [Myxococcota bacterium]|nr:CBS domain-containing protein [Myxococcota bacterium]
MPTVRELMTPSPHTIGADQPIAEAMRRMRQAQIRHLPVLEGAQLVGLLSDRDVRLVEALDALRGGGAEQRMRVSDAMSPEPYVVGIDDDLAGIVSTMAERKLGSAIVTDQRRVVGIFTTTDALHLLMRHLDVAELRRGF